MQKQESSGFYIISDVHITGDRQIDSDVSIRSLIEFLKEKRGKELIILGDFFDLRKDETKALSRGIYKELFDAFRDYSKTAEITYILGNHDRLVCKNKKLCAFLEKHGIRIAKDKYWAERKLNGKRICFEHGNQFDEMSFYRSMDNEDETPLSEHLTQGFLPLAGKKSWLNELWLVRPYKMTPKWLFSKFYYNNASRSLKFMLAPFFASWFITKLLPVILLLLLFSGRIRVLQDRLIFFILLVIIATDFSSFFLRQILKKVSSEFREILEDIGYLGESRLIQRENDFKKRVNEMLETGKAHFCSKCDILVNGHTHFPDVKKSKSRMYINSGCWIKSFTEVKSFFLMPSVYLDEYELNFVEVSKEGNEIKARLKAISPIINHKLNWLEELSIITQLRKIRKGDIVKQEKLISEQSL
jgi:UDP-2,3-diacylglucosamine pyrophosphatase LpxH